MNDTLKLFLNCGFGLESTKILQYIYGKLFRTSLNNDTKYVNDYWFINFNTRV